MNNYSVYMHINLTNNKKYVGISKDPIARWANGSGYHRNKHFADSIKRYGWENFAHLILKTNLSKEEACELERQLIREYNTRDKRFGYNLTDGGEHFLHSEASKRKMSENRKGKGKVKRTQEQIEHMKAAHSGGADRRAVECVETKKIYESINDASRDTGINKKGISGCCRGVIHYNTAGGFHWRFAMNEG